ncbi:hypothetical protein [Cereibacter johrii]|uniref:hypothetical protein n=1 Tax=Cereibacter johrii TaxID=445629 RepID=UPI003CF4DC85
MRAIRWIYILLALYLPFESYIAAWLIKSETGVLLAKQVSDGVIILTFLAFLFLSTAGGQAKYRDICPGCLPLVLFFSFFSVMTTAWNGGDILVGVLQVKATMRYVLVAYVVANVGFSSRQMGLFFRFFTIAVMVNLGLASIQVLFPSIAASFNPYGFIGQNQSGALVSTSQMEGGSAGVAFGAALNTIEFAFLLAAWWIAYAGAGIPNGRNQLALSLIWLAPVAIFVFLSDSKIAFLALMLSAYLHFARILSGHALRILNSSIAFMATAGAFALLIELGIVELPDTGFLSFLSGDYIEIAKLQRLGIVTTYLEMIESFSGDILLGLGGDPIRTVKILESQGYRLPYLLMFSPASIEDVYWVAIFIFYGLIGAGAMFLALGKLFVRTALLSRGARVLEVARLNAAVANLLVFIFVTGIMNQILEVKQFSFYFWFLVGYARFIACNIDRDSTAARLQETAGKRSA